MPIVQVADTVFARAERLAASEKGRIVDLIGKLYRDPSHPSLSLERVRGARSPGIWAARVSGDLRAILHMEGDAVSVLHVDHHDAAYDWASRRTIGRHSATGILQVVEAVESISEVAHALEPPVAPQAPALFAAHADAYLVSLGLPETWLPALRAVRTEDQLLTICGRLPPDVAERLIDLSQGEIVTPPLPVVSAGAAAAPRSDERRRFYAYVADDEAELRAAIEAPHERWIAFLHPSQRALVEGEFRGPVKVAGGAGTGKTVVALHRARHLARRGRRVLLTSYVTTLCRTIERQLDRLCGPDAPERARITVSTVDKQALAIVRQVEPRLRPATDDEIRDALDRVLARPPEGASQGGAAADPAFVRAEWTNVVQAQGIGAWEEYRSARRTGRGRPISVRERRALWAVFDAVMADLAQRDHIDFPGLCRRAEALVTSGRVASPFDAVVVDEVQDLRPPALRFVRALAAADPGLLMLVGDASQRIYASRVNLGACGIAVRGRSHTLRVNYRTTEQIRRAADRVLGAEQDDLDGGAERRQATRSLLRGPRPRRAAFPTPAAELEHAVRTIRGWMDAGITPASIAVFLRAGGRRLDAVSATLETAGIPTRRLADETVEARDGVALGTLFRAKGLEFRAVLVLDASAAALPSPPALRAAPDPQDREDVLARERHLLHVAMTRARDELCITWSGEPSPFLADLPADVFADATATREEEGARA